MQFRTDISFLRAISVLMVMFFHFQIPIFKGGFIGVDIFFVISGFLMTQITLNAFDNKKFSLKEFYLKRVKRIIPALQFVLYFVLLVSIIFFLSTDIKLNSKYVFLANFFASNIYFWQYLNYFSSKDNILLHTWSLGVEWQFYIIYPLILLILKRFYHTKEKIFWIIMSLLTLLSFVLMISVYKTENNFSFYMLPTRYWELSIGGLAYGFMRFFRVGDFSKKIIFLISITLILISVFLISENNIWPSYLTTIPVLATTLILLCNVKSNLFDNKIINFLGNISYSLYLWHWPWFILFKYFGFLDTEHIVLLILLSFIFSIVSYYYIEKNRFFSSGKVIFISTILLAIISSLLFINPILLKKISIYQNENFEIGNYTSEYNNKYKDNQFNPCGCYETFERYNKIKCLQLSNSKPNVLLIGDSHAAQFSSELRKAKNINLLEVSTGYVLPILKQNGKQGHKELIEYVFNEYIPENKSNISLIVISASWIMNRNANINMSNEEVINEVENLIKYFNQLKINYLIIGQTETYKLSFPKILMLENFGREDSEFIEKESLEMNENLIKIISPNNYINVFTNPNINRYDKDLKKPYMFDDNHLTEFGAKQYIDKLIMPRINLAVSR